MNLQERFMEHLFTEVYLKDLPAMIDVDDAYDDFLEKVYAHELSDKYYQFESEFVMNFLDEMQDEVDDFFDFDDDEAEYDDDEEAFEFDSTATTESFIESMEIDPQSDEADFLRISFMDDDEERLVASLKLLDKLKSTYPMDQLNEDQLDNIMRVYHEAADAMGDLGKVRKQVELLKEAVQLDKQDEYIFKNSLLNCYAYLEDRNEAEAIFDQIENKGMSILFAMMLLYYKCDEMEQAKKLRTQLLDQYPNFLNEYAEVAEIILEDEYDELFNESYNDVEDLVLRNYKTLSTVPYFDDWLLSE